MRMRIYYYYVRYSRKPFEGEIFRGLRGLRVIRESFLREVWGRVAPIHDWFQAIRESFLREILTFTDPRKVSPSKIYRYTYILFWACGLTNHRARDSVYYMIIASIIQLQGNPSWLPDSAYRY